jgi:hypothetical protein
MTDAIDAAVAIQFAFVHGPLPGFDSLTALLRDVSAINIGA